MFSKSLNLYQQLKLRLPAKNVGNTAPIRLRYFSFSPYFVSGKTPLAIDMNYDFFENIITLQSTLELDCLKKWIALPFSPNSSSVKTSSCCSRRKLKLNRVTERGGIRGNLLRGHS